MIKIIYSRSCLAIVIQIQHRITCQAPTFFFTPSQLFLPNRYQILLVLFPSIIIIILLLYRYEVIENIGKYTCVKRNAYTQSLRQINALDE